MTQRAITIIRIAEIILAGLIVWSDFFVPTLFLLVLVGVSLFLRKQHLSSLGFKKIDNWPAMIVKIVGLMMVWTLVVLAVIAPVLDHVFGLQQDVSTFADLQGNLGLFFGLLVASWTLAAVGEETVYRGFLFTRGRDLFSNRTWSYMAGVLISASLFGLAHTEQGLAGVIITFFDAIYFSLIRRHFKDNLWAAVLAHGISNTIGIVGFFLLGPISSLW